MPLNPSLVQFIRSRIGSIDELEVLLLLRREAETWWRVDEVASHLGLTPASALMALERISGGFLEVRVLSDLCFRFSPTNSERERLAAELAEAYEGSRHEVTAMIGGFSAAVEDFADAFRLRNKE